MFLIGYLLGNVSKKTPPQVVTPTPTATVTLTPTVTPTNTIEVTPTETTIPTGTATPTSVSVKFLKVTSEKPTEGAGTGSYKFSFLKCTDSHCDHYLLPTAKVAQFPILATVESEMPFSFLISTNTDNLGAAAGNTYLEMTTATEIYLGTTYEGIRSDLGDGKSYYSFQTGVGGEWSVSRVYLLDKTKASSLLKSLLVDSRKGKTAYIGSKVTGGGAAAGTTYYYMTSGITVYFK